ncbi:MAG: electron transfer flavoprotein subunit beta/FixA family protein [Chloroflexota bacterium]|nr:MAG: electron transfer flavoprotein subunit beta/FixA family protein [Chloroflexota bacterium]
MPYNIVVLLKRVPDTESKITIRDNAVVTEGLNFVLDPYGEYGLEKALQLVEQNGGKVTAVLFGPEEAKETIRKALAVGADEAIHIVDPALEGGDAGTTAQVLAAALKKIPFDMVWAGKQAVDEDNAQVPIRVAELLDLPHVNSIIEFEIGADGKSARCVREVDGERDVMVTILPAILTAQQGLGEVRYPSLKGIMGAKKKPITDWNAAALGIDPSSVGKQGARVEIIGLEPPPARPPGKIIPGDAATAAKELARLLREEAKVI